MLNQGNVHVFKVCHRLPDDLSETSYRFTLSTALCACAHFPARSQALSAKAISPSLICTGPSQWALERRFCEPFRDSIWKEAPGQIKAEK